MMSADGDGGIIYSIPTRFAVASKVGMADVSWMFAVRWVESKPLNIHMYISNW